MLWRAMLCVLLAAALFACRDKAWQVGESVRALDSDVAAALDQGDAEAGDRTELGANDHRADDQDWRAEEETDRCDQAGEDHEDEEIAAELDALRGARLDLLPDDRVGGQAARRALGAVGVVGKLRVDLLERDRAQAGDAESLEIVDQNARFLAGDVAEDQVARRLAGHPGEEDEVRGRCGVAQQVHNLRRQLGRDDDPQVDHVRSVSRRAGPWVPKKAPRDRHVPGGAVGSGGC